MGVSGENSPGAEPELKQELEQEQEQELPPLWERRVASDAYHSLAAHEPQPPLRKRDNISTRPTLGPKLSPSFRAT